MNWVTFRERLKRWWWVALVLAVAFPLLRLIPLSGRFNKEWDNHEWLATYAGTYLRQHGSAVVEMSTPQQIGMPYPVFYGTLFYPLLGIFTTVLDAGFVFRVVAVFLTWLQFRLVSAALATLDVPVWLARGVACLVIWAIYPLTNLYSRGAMTEYVATALLTCVVASWFLLLDAKHAIDRARIGLGIGLMFAFAAGTHPITALYSLPVLGLLLVAALAEHRLDRAFWGRVLKALALPAVLAVVVLLPWLYVLAQYQSKLQVTVGSAGGVWFYPGLDEWTTRFSPLPLDPRTDSAPLAEVSSPYIDAQVNIALAALLVGWLALLIWRNRRVGLAGLRAVSGCLFAFVFFSCISLSARIYDLLPAIAHMLQIAYRAVTYQNISLLLGILILASALRRRGDRSLFAGRPVAAWMLIGCLALSATGVAITFVQFTSILRVGKHAPMRATASGQRRSGSLPGSFYGLDAYATPSLYTPLSPKENERRRDEQLPMSGDFGVPRPLRLNPSPTENVWVATNIQAFPWNRVLLDGHVAPDDQLRSEGSRLVVAVPPGDHEISFDSVPDPTWMTLRTVSFGVLASWIALFCSLSIRAWRRARRLKATALPAHLAA